MAEGTHEHDSVGELRLVVETVDLSAVLRDGGEGEDVVEVESKGGVDVVDESLNVLLGSLVEGDDGEGRSSGTELLEDGLVAVRKKKGGESKMDLIAGDEIEKRTTRRSSC